MQNSEIYNKLRMYSKSHELLSPLVAQIMSNNVFTEGDSINVSSFKSQS